MYILKESEAKLSYRDTIRLYGLEDKDDDLHDKWIRWHNFNNKSILKKIVDDEDNVLIGKLRYFIKFIKNESNLSIKTFTIKEFEDAQNNVITLWRGGSGIYDKDYNNGNLISFTAEKKRVKAFSTYKGTKSSQDVYLDKNEQSWVVELKIPLSKILMYYDVGDDEVIISSEDSKKAKLIEVNS